MAMGRLDAVQDDLMAPWAEMPRSPGHAFYDRLQDLLGEAGFDAFVEGVCKPYYAPRMGAPSLPPGRYFRMHMIGYFEGIDSERGIAWRCADSFSLRDFLRLSNREKVPDHSWLSRTRSRLPHEAHETVFERCVAGDDESPRNAGEIACQAFRDPVDEISCSGPRPRFRKGRTTMESRGGASSGEDGKTRGVGVAANCKGEDPDRLGDVLELDGAEALGREVDPPFYLTPGILREADPVGRSDAFETRGDIDAERAFVVGAGQARTADDIGDEDRGELADFRH